jgi:hypothetical protein
MARQIGPLLAEPEAAILQAHLRAVEARVIALDARTRELEARLAAVEAANLLDDESPVGPLEPTL